MGLGQRCVQPLVGRVPYTIVLLPYVVRLWHLTMDADHWMRGDGELSLAVPSLLRRFVFGGRRGVDWMQLDQTSSLFRSII